jgi:hypothetical protein
MKRIRGIRSTQKVHHSLQNSPAALHSVTLSGNEKIISPEILRDNEVRTKHREITVGCNPYAWNILNHSDHISPGVLLHDDRTASPS